MNTLLLAVWKRMQEEDTLENNFVARGSPLVRYLSEGKSVRHLCGFGEDIQQRNAAIPIELRKCD